MNILQNRIDSFKTGTVKWPHAEKHHYKIESFARAGFYFVRRPKAIDSIRCFLCDKDFSNWKASQSPFTRHAKESPNCPWNALNFPDASNKAVTVKQKDPNLQPRSTTMRAARLATFNNHNFWPPNKGMLGRSKRYPAASKLADAGFFFSPTLEQSARIRCPYCKITIDEPEKHTNMLDKHQELSEECIFFEPTHHIRTAKNRRDTMGSIKSTESFKTANDELEDSMDTDKEHSLYEPSFIQVEKRKTKKKVDDLEIDSEDEESDSKRPSKNGPTKRSAKSTKKEPTKIVKRKKVNDTVMNTNGKRKREESTTDKDAEQDNDESIWNIEQTFTPTSTVRKPVITFGNKKSRVIPSSRRSNPTSVDIFSNLKRPLIEKPYVDKSQKNVKSIGSDKKPLIGSTKLADPSPRKLTITKKSLDTPMHMFDDVDEEDIAKHDLVSPSTSKPIVNTPSSSSSSSSLKEPLKNVSSSAQPSNLRSTDSVENHEPVVNKPYRDKGKGRAVEYNLSLPSLPAVKKPISLSKSKKSPPKSPEITPFAPISHNLSPFKPFASNSRGSSLSFELNDSTCNQLASTVVSSFDPKIPATNIEQEASSPIATFEKMSIDTILPDNVLNDLPDFNTLMETTPPIDLMDNSSKLSVTSPTTKASEERVPSPKLKKENIPNNRTPSPQIIQDNFRNKTPPPFILASTPRTIAKSFSFMQSTPNREARAVNAFDIFGDCPMSPIRPAHKTSALSNSVYQDTPVMGQGGRSRNVIMKEADGVEKLVQSNRPALPPPLDINNIQPAGITEKQKKMKVEEYLQGLFEEKIEEIRAHGMNEIKKIEAASEEIKNTLTASMNP